MLLITQPYPQASSFKIDRTANSQMIELINFSSNPRFPPELIDSFFSFLQVEEGLDQFDEGVATLKRCSTDPVLCQFAEKHYYSTITIRNSVESYPGVFNDDILAELFSEQPHIAHYVRNMKIILASSPKPCLGDVLSRVSRLESIALSLEETECVPWTFLPESFRTAFVACIKSPCTMKKVVLENHLEFHLSVLDDCNIENLIFRNVCLGIEPQSAPLHPTPHPVLDSLTLDSVQAYGPQFDVWAKNHIHALRSLIISPWDLPNIMMFDMSVLFPLCSNTLTSLHIDFLGNFSTLYDVNNGTITATVSDCFRFSLSTLPRLQQLTISADIIMVHKRIYAYNYVRLENHSALPTICQVLATSPPSVARLTLHLRIRFRFDCNASVLSTLDWQPLVKVLDSSSLSAQQTHMHVIVHTDGYRTIRLDALIPTLCKSVDLSRLVEQGALVIHGSIKVQDG